MPPIHTLTGNLLWERTLSFPAWQEGKTQRATGDAFQVGGKGINVSRMLARLGTPSNAIAFVGGHTGDHCADWLRQKLPSTRLIPTVTPTRIGIVVRSSEQSETSFFSADASPDADALKSCADFISTRPAGEILALCGSFPGWSSPDAAVLREAIINRCKQGPVIVDTYGAPLADLARHPVDLIKINRNEFDVLRPASAPAASFAQRLQEASASLPAKAWIVTDGPRAVWMIEKGGSPHSYEPPRITEISPTGSGDVLLACLLHCHVHLGLPLADSVQHALPYAAANAAFEGMIDFPTNNLPPLGSIPQK